MTNTYVANPGSPAYYAFKPSIKDRKDWTTWAALSSSAGSHPHKTYLDYPQSESSFTFQEVFDKATRIASGLKGLGLDAGSRVAIICNNRPEFIFSWLGISGTRLVQVPINPALKGSMLRHQLELTKPRVIIVEQEFVEQLLELDGSIYAESAIYVVGQGALADQVIGQLQNRGLRAKTFADLESSEPTALDLPNERDTAVIFFTSGTTSAAKGVTMSHASLSFAAQEFISTSMLTADDTFMSCSPLFHGNGQMLNAYSSLITGARFVLYKKFSASQWLNWVIDSKATVTALLGVMTDFVWAQPPSPRDRENDLRCVFTLPALPTADKFASRFGVEFMTHVYGMTEISIPLMKPYGVEAPLGSCGLQVADWFDVAVIDPVTEEPVPVGQSGELVVRPKSPYIMSTGYFEMPEITVNTYRNLWFHTGDRVRQDEAGWFYFMDRLDDSIRRRGENISSYELEQIFLSRDGVIEAAAVAIPAEHGGEDEIAVFVAAREDVSVDSLYELAERQLPAFCQPQVITIVEQLPKTPTGKIQKAKLRERATTVAISTGH